MQKVFLSARPANEGVRRLAWWLLDEAVPRQILGLRRSKLASADVGEISLNRLLAGELLPGEVMGWAISRATRGAVRVGDWRDLPEGAWAERPVEHVAMKHAA